MTNPQDTEVEFRLRRRRAQVAAEFTEWLIGSIESERDPLRWEGDDA